MAVEHLVFRESFPSEFEAMARTLGNAMDALLEQDVISGEEAPTVRLCLEEALVNAIRHGNRCEHDRTVSLAINASSDDCTIKVGDEGRGFSPESVSLPDCDQMGGRGICLIRHFMDMVCYNTTENCLEMKFDRKAICKEEGRS